MAVLRGIERKNTVDEEQYAQLVGTYFATKTDAYNCRVCLAPARVINDANFMEGERLRINTERKRKGCWGPEPMADSIQKRDPSLSREQALARAGYTIPEASIRFSCCPGNFYTPWAAGVIKLWNLFRRGIMPAAGGTMDQPAWLLDAFSVLDKLESEKEGNK